MGPLGQGFVLTDDLKGAYLVGGGIGVAPLVELAVQMSEAVVATLFYGERFGRMVVPDRYLEVDSVERVLATEDGRRGLAGLVTEPLAEALARRPAPVFACGPRAMLAEVARLAEQAGVEAQVSLEAHMACGLGACLGCVTEIKTKNKAPAYARVCLEGPVFRAEEIKW
jgi:dihydroorotate dehydrogenase electron transfer subunit